MARMSTATMQSYLGKCKTKGCKHATHVDYADVQILDSGHRDGDVLLTEQGAPYDHAKPFILNGMNVAARCPEHGVYRLQLVKGRLVPDHKSDARCLSATGPK